MSLLGLDLNASCVRAALGRAGDYPCAVPLDPPRTELPLAISVEGRTLAVGTSALRMCRKFPQLVLLGFLPQIGDQSTSSHANSPVRHPLSAEKALHIVFEHVQRACRFANGVVLALPAYLPAQQVDMVLTVACQTGLPVFGSIAGPLAAALHGHAERNWFGGAIVVDVDDHALTVAAIRGSDGQAQLRDVRCFPHLNCRVWRERLLNALADSSILESRWDPRESPLSDQSLFDQLDNVLEAAQQGRMIKVAVQTAKRFQSLVLPAHAPASFCASLRRQVLAEVENSIIASGPECAAGTVLLTAAAGRLPGLVAALRQVLPQWHAATAKPKQTISTLEDFGSNLLDDSESAEASVVVLGPGAAAQGAHAVGSHFQRGELASGHIETAPLPLPLPLEAGPARLHYQGRDYLLGTISFTLGRPPNADLPFDAEQWPQVAARHCDIIYDHRVHMLCNRSRDGTLVNDRPARQSVPLRPGDWIRLGPDGPVVRFLGHNVEKNRNHE